MPNFWFKFEWESWRHDRQLLRCSKETRGFWIDCIAAMEEQQTFFIEGTPEEICREVVADRGEFDRSIAELSRTGAATIEKCQEVVKIVSRRLLKKLNLTEYNRLKQQERRERIASSGGQDSPSKDIDSKTLRALDSSPTGEEVDKPKPTKPEPKILLPENYRPTPAMFEWAGNDCPLVPLETELVEFRTFWIDIATKNNKRTPRGWHATWKKRMRDVQERLSVRNNGNGPKPPTRPDVPANDDAVWKSEPDPPCPYCGKEICWNDHRADMHIQ